MFRKKNIAILILVFVLLLVAYTKFNQQKEFQRLTKERAFYEAEISRLETLKEALEEELKNASRPEYIENIARQKLKMVKPTEMIFIVNESRSSD